MAVLCSRFKQSTLPQNGIQPSVHHRDTAGPCTSVNYQLLPVEGHLWKQSPALPLQISATACVLPPPFSLGHQSSQVSSCLCRFDLLFHQLQTRSHILPCIMFCLFNFSVAFNLPDRSFLVPREPPFFLPQMIIFQCLDSESQRQLHTTPPYFLWMKF